MPPTLLMMHRCAFHLPLLVCLLVASAHDHLRGVQSEAAHRQGRVGPLGRRYRQIHKLDLAFQPPDPGLHVRRQARQRRRRQQHLPQRIATPRPVRLRAAADREHRGRTTSIRPTSIAYSEQAVAAGKKRVILFVFDGMDWWTTWAAAVHQAGDVRYSEGRGSGLHFQDYRGVETDFGYMVTSPASGDGKCDVDDQDVTIPGSATLGGYDWRLAGDTPWSRPADPLYLIGKSRERKHAYTDSASSATSMTAGIKTYNVAVNCDALGHPVKPISQQLQEQGWAIGVVTSVPISHATPAAPTPTTFTATIIRT